MTLWIPGPSILNVQSVRMTVSGLVNEKVASHCLLTWSCELSYKKYFEIRHISPMSVIDVLYILFAFPFTHLLLHWAAAFVPQSRHLGSTTVPYLERWPHQLFLSNCATTFCPCILTVSWKCVCFLLNEQTNTVYNNSSMFIRFSHDQNTKCIILYYGTDIFKIFMYCFYALVCFCVLMCIRFILVEKNMLWFSKFDFHILSIRKVNLFDIFERIKL